ncbi:hypothetical protein V6N12_052900 [Hibiscus sabdariffa]|uniref:ClpA/ClpB AAA lid domain-containing protein n=1 Tax=Hibiscus sabdariffa TaxID=183260 RepID=A0ABR2C4E4_9ROSI
MKAMKEALQLLLQMRSMRTLIAMLKRMIIRKTNGTIAYGERHGFGSAILADQKLSNQYISDGFLPDKAIDLFEKVGAHVSTRRAENPIASFIFYGPTGVGKSKLAKALAATYFGSEEAVIQFGMIQTWLLLPSVVV